MIIYVDENMPPVFAEGFQTLQAPLVYKLGITESILVKSVATAFKPGIADEDWIPELKNQRACIITQDISIHHRPHQKALYEQYNVGMFFLCPPKKRGLSYWEQVSLLVKYWPAVLEKASNEPRPFSFKITLGSTVLKRI